MTDDNSGVAAALAALRAKHTKPAPPRGAQGAPKGEHKRYALVRFAELRPDTRPSFLVDGIIPASGLVAIWGPPKCGKSFWTFDLVMHIALHREYRGRRVHGGPVVYLAFEGAAGFGARAEAFRRANEGLPSDIQFYLVASNAKLVRDHQALIESIDGQADLPPVAVVLDTLNRSIDGSESKDQDMGAYLSAAEAIIEAFDCAVIIVHHCGTDGSRPRGHTSLTGAVDAQLAIKRDSAGNVVVVVEWMKDGKDGSQITSRLETVEVGTNSDGATITSCAVVPADAAPAAPPSTRKGKGEPTSHRTFRDAFIEALGACGKTVHIRNDGPAVRAVDIAMVRAEFDRRYATGDTDPKKRKDSQRKAFNRALDHLSRQFPTWVDGNTEWMWSLR